MSFSIGTLDEDVWRTTEPGTPHPLKRVEAVARLNEAGIPCGVLVAPILPGPLRPPRPARRRRARLRRRRRDLASPPCCCTSAAGVREHYLRTLADTRPDLVELHERSLRPRRLRAGRGAGTGQPARPRPRPPPPGPLRAAGPVGAVGGDRARDRARPDRHGPARIQPRLGPRRLRTRNACRTCSAPTCGTTAPTDARFCPSCGQALVARPDERRVATVLFADLVGFTELLRGRRSRDA